MKKTEKARITELAYVSAKYMARKEQSDRLLQAILRSSTNTDYVAMQKLIDSKRHNDAILSHMRQCQDVLIIHYKAI